MARSANRHRIRLPLAALIGTALLFGLPAPVHAQAPAPAPAAAQTAAAPSPSTDDLKALVGTLENDAARQKFLAQLKALIAAREQTTAPAGAPEASIQNFGARAIMAVSERMQYVGIAVTDVATAVVNLPNLVAQLRSQAHDNQHRRDWLRLFGKIAAVLVAALIVDWLVRRLLRRPRQALQPKPGDRTWLRGIFLAGRFVMELVPIAAFGAVANLALPFVNAHTHVRLTTLAVVNAVVIVRAILAVARLLLSPDDGQRRLFAVSDETAGYCYVWLRRLASLVIYGYFAAQVFALLGLPPAGYQLFTKLVGLATVALLIVLILQNRKSTARWIRGAVASEAAQTGLRVLRARLAEIWHVLALLYVVAIYVVWALRVEGGFEFVMRATVLTVVILVAAKTLASGSEGLFGRFFAIGADLKKRVPALEARADRYVPVLTGTVHTLIYLFAAIGLLQVWGLGSFAWLSSEAGRHIVASLAAIVLTVALTLIVWEAINVASEIYLAKKMPHDGAMSRRSLRARTLMPLLRRMVAMLLAAIAGLIILSALGINIGPLLAGLGVAGIAVGLGAQSLVKDLITGIFIVIEDTIAVGDVVELAGNSGQVEAISIRTIRLRDLSGTVYTIPFSEVTHIKNLTKDFSYALFDIGVAYRENVDQVIKVILDLGAELKSDPAFGRLIIAPLEMIGLDRFEDSAVIIRARIKTLPIEQWNVMREFNRRLKQRFDELGIEIPFPQRTVYFGVDKSGQAPPLRVSTGGAADAAPGAAVPKTTP